MESKKINQLATELAPDLSDLTIIGDPTTGISKKITLSQMASLFTGTVEEYANLAAFPLVGVADTIYVALDTNIIYRWDTSLSTYVVLSPNIINSLVFSDANGFDGTITLVGSVATLSITTALTLGSVPFIGASGALLQDNANFFWDDTNNRLGLGTNAPTTALDVFGSGIIGRLNATSTNNSFLGFASAGTNKWSIGNVQSDHRFRIYSEANTSELVSILQTGEFGIGIANPTTKLHIDGGASALIANLDANVSVAKSVSFRSDNSSRINLEVSGTESGSNAGADFFLRTFTDAGALLETPFTIVRSTGVTTIKSLTLTNVLSIANGGTGSATQNFIDLTSVQTAAGAKTFSAITSISNATASTSTTTGALKVTGGVGIGGALFGTSAVFSGFLGVNGSPGTSFPLEAYINSSTAYTTSSRGNTMRVYNSNLGANIFAGIELGGAGPSNDGLAGINAVVTDAGSAALTFYTRNSSTFAERFRITSVGQIGIGVTPSSWSASNSIKPIQNPAGSFWNFNLENNYVGLNYYYDGSNRRYVNTGVASEYQQSGDHSFYTAPSGTAGAVATFSERMRITTAGYVGIGVSPGYMFHVQGNLTQSQSLFYNTLNAGTEANILLRLGSNCNNTSSTYLSGGIFGVADKFYIYGNGNMVNANNSYGLLSDIKLKENIVDATPKLEDILKVRIVNYNLISDPEQKQIGVIAQELEEIFPGLIDEHLDKDFEGNLLGTTTKMVKMSIFVPMLIKAMQEQQAQIEELKAKIK